METQDFVNAVLNGIFFYIAYKIGQFSVYAKLTKDTLTKLKEPNVITVQKRIISVEEINGVYFAYDGNDFLAQGTTPDELGRLIANRFPEKYAGARIVIKN